MVYAKGGHCLPAVCVEDTRGGVTQVPAFSQESRSHEIDAAIFTFLQKVQLNWDSDTLSTLYIELFFGHSCCFLGPVHRGYRRIVLHDYRTDKRNPDFDPEFASTGRFNDGCKGIT